jgi:hypothetical protein
LALLLVGTRSAACAEPGAERDGTVAAGVDRLGDDAEGKRSDHPLRRPHRGRQLTMTITTVYTDERTDPLLGQRPARQHHDAEANRRSNGAAIIDFLRIVALATWRAR